MTPRELAADICRKLQASGFKAYLVGGCVRDLLLNREPEDYDVATDAHPARVQELFPSSADVGARFGVILVVANSSQVEVATFRSDVGYSDGRHPDRVEYSNSPEEDVRRRDFTINGLMMDVQTQQILDFVGGREDLLQRIVRAIGEPDLRFREDRLRMVRAVRFAARFGYVIEPATFQAILAAAPHITAVSAERLRDEITKLLTEGAARRAFELLDQTGLLKACLPEVAAMKGVAQPPEFHPEGDVWVHTLLMLEKLPAGEIGARMAVAICRRLRFSVDDIEQIEALVANHLRFKDVFQMRPATLKRFVRLPKFEEQHLPLHRLDCLASHGNLDAYDFVQRFLRDTPPEEVRPTRLFREILQAVEEGQLEGRLMKREDALDFVRRQYQNVG
jgi:poly(A) polymerase